MEIKKVTIYGTSNTANGVTHNSISSNGEVYTLNYDRTTGQLKISKSFVPDEATKKFLDDAVAQGIGDLKVTVPPTGEVIKLGKVTSIDFIN